MNNHHYQNHHQHFEDKENFETYNRVGGVGGVGRLNHNDSDSPFGKLIGTEDLYFINSNRRGAFEDNISQRVSHQPVLSQHTALKTNLYSPSTNALVVSASDGLSSVSTAKLPTLVQELEHLSSSRKLLHLSPFIANSACNSGGVALHSLSKHNLSSTVEGK